MLSVLLFSLGAPEIIVIALLVLLLFGGKKLPELMKGLGKGIREFNSAKASIKNEIEEGIQEEERRKNEPQKESKE